MKTESELLKEAVALISQVQNGLVMKTGFNTKIFRGQWLDDQYKFMADYRKFRDEQQPKKEGE